MDPPPTPPDEYLRPPPDSLVPLSAALGSDGNRFYIMHVTSSESSRGEFKSTGLTYEGATGQNLARVQLFTVVLAAGVSLLPWTWPRRVG